MLKEKGAAAAAAAVRYGAADPPLHGGIFGPRPSGSPAPVHSAGGERSLQIAGSVLSFSSPCLFSAAKKEGQMS